MICHYTTQIAPPVDLAVGRWAGRQVGRSGVGGRQSPLFASRRTPGTREMSFRALLCHPERSEGSRSASSGSLNKDQGEIPRSARNDSAFQSRRAPAERQIFRDACRFFLTRLKALFYFANGRWICRGFSDRASGSSVGEASARHTSHCPRASKEACKQGRTGTPGLRVCLRWLIPRGGT